MVAAAAGCGTCDSGLAEDRVVQDEVAARLGFSTISLLSCLSIVSVDVIQLLC